MNSPKKKIFIVFILIYFLVGAQNSIKSGISFDEKHEELNWKFHTWLIGEFKDKIFHNKPFDFEFYDSEVKKFVGYGIGFQIISQPIQSILKNLLILNNDISNYGAKLLSKHFVIFTFFFISGIFFYLILRKLIDNEDFCVISTIIYLTYPYLFGQSMFSPKDIPFLSVWLMCTYLVFNLIDKLIRNDILNNKEIILISFCTAFLLSIRIAGLLIFIQYLLLLIFYTSVFEKKLSSFVKRFYPKFLIFSLFFLLFTFLFYPILWLEPFLIFETVNINTNHFNNVGTNTLGKIMYSHDLPSTYIPIWLSVKLPLIILIGFLIIPFCEKKIFNDKKKSIFFGSLLLTVLLIPLILIIKKVHLYDEIRQIMFLIPLIFILGLVSLHTISKKIFYSLGILTICFFIIENIKINPYQYVWFNLPSRSLDITEKFELEYQGISGREVAKYISQLDNQKNCILVNPLHTVKPFLDNTKFDCFDVWQKIDTNYERPFLAVQHVRNLKKSLPYNCEKIHETNFKLIFYKKKIITSKLLECK